jgi:DNA gyrase subunit B
VFCELYAGGKFSDEYGFSLGLNGLGLCATQYASEYMEVEIFRDGFQYNLRFEHGEIAGDMNRAETKKKQTGTRIKWRPDIAVFTEISVPAEYFADILKRQAVVNNGLRLIFKEQTETGFIESEFLYEDGIAGYVKEFAGGEAFTPVQMWQAERLGRDREDKPEYKVKLGAALCFSNRVKLLEYYHNSSFLEHGGSPDRAVKVASVGILDAYLKQQQKYLKGESKITFQDVEDCLVFVSSSFSTQTSYENQTKKAINNKFVYEAMTDFLRHGLEVYFTENPDEAAKIAEQVLINKRSRENAEKTRLNLKKKLAGGLEIANRVQKFVDCRSKDLSIRELYIVEGDSALGACKLGRDSEFQAIIPVRGKILNCLKAEYDKIFKNDIITDIIKVLGCGVEVNVKSRGKELSSFDLSGLRWNKVVICTDADVDGFQIRALILTMLYRLTPTLINEGYVYIAESPLYEITAKDKTYFAYSDNEKSKMLEKINGKYTLQRSKGLGENEPDMMWLTTMNPKTRRLIKVSPTAATETAQMFETLLGDNLQGRKDFIAEFGQNYLEAADIS